MNEQENKNNQIDEEYVTTYYVYGEGEVKEESAEGEDSGYFAQSIENERILRERKEREEYVQKRRYNRTPLMLSLIGMILSLFCGVGIALAIPAFIMSISRLKSKPSKPLRWALVISAVTIFVSAVFIVCFSYALVTGLVEYFRILEEMEGSALGLILA